LQQTLLQLEKDAARSVLRSFLTASSERSRVNRLLHKKIKIGFMTLPKTSILLSLLAWLLIAVSCDHSVVTKLTPSNYDQITTGMTKAQVERILGPPTTVETKDMMIFKKTTYRYEDGKKFAMFTFKNDELDSKEGNLQREP
jgi:SmpA / OmlA family